MRNKVLSQLIFQTASKNFDFGLGRHRMNASVSILDYLKAFSIDW